MLFSISRTVRCSATTFFSSSKASIYEFGSANSASSQIAGQTGVLVIRKRTFVVEVVQLEWRSLLLSYLNIAMRE